MSEDSEIAQAYKAREHAQRSKKQRNQEWSTQRLIELAEYRQVH